jgi:hypothetical protein
MEIGEAVNLDVLEASFKDDCPFKDDLIGVGEVEEEDVADDDLDEQENSGGVLGRNLIGGKPGKDGTWTGDPPPTVTALRIDTRRTHIKVKVPGTATVKESVYGFTVAAHHLIPGEASLAPSTLKKFMTQGESVEIHTNKGTKNKKIAKHIGYNVNGSHNGVWLPGNYYIRASTSPVAGKSWSDLGDDPWCLNYVAAVVRVAGAQFHDAHTKYSAAVEDFLNKISDRLCRHECDLCKSDEISPPSRIKNRLYAVSDYLRGQVEAEPAAWKRPWFTSDRWRDGAFSGTTPSSAFVAAYNKASATGF